MKTLINPQTAQRLKEINKELKPIFKEVKEKFGSEYEFGSDVFSSVTTGSITDAIASMAEDILSVTDGRPKPYESKFTVNGPWTCLGRDDYQGTLALIDDKGCSTIEELKELRDVELPRLRDWLDQVIAFHANGKPLAAKRSSSKKRS